MSLKMVVNGHVVLAKSVFNEDFYLAWGETPPGHDISNWGLSDLPPQEDGNSTELLQEIGRRQSTIKFYVKEDTQGSIDIDGIKWSQSDTPTRHIYLQFKFEQGDAASQTIRQVGIFQGGTRKQSVPIGKGFLVPDDLEDKGTLFLLKNIPPILRNAATREIQEYIITF